MASEVGPGIELQDRALKLEVREPLFLVGVSEHLPTSSLFPEFIKGFI